jgi:hypothetical protein
VEKGLALIALESWTDHVDGETQQSKGMSLTLSDWFYEGILQ